MDEGTGKAIPLRRSRSTSRAVTATPATGLRSFGALTALTSGVTSGVQRVVEPGRQLWLAGLGGTTITLRGARELWSLLVSEGAATEQWLRQAVRRTPPADTSATG